MKKILKPEVGEYAPYAIMYIDLVPDDGLVLQYLQDTMQTLKTLILAQPEELLVSRCAEGEWTIKEILSHVIDTERIFCYRALRFARNDTTELPGFDQDFYVAYAHANQRHVEAILEEFTAVRTATIALFNSFDSEVWLRSGRSNGDNLTVRAAVYQIAGHELHHTISIKENYLSNVSFG
jgi:uncharacterized damage-inducible protein DinB